MFRNLSFSVRSIPTTLGFYNIKRVLMRVGVHIVVGCVDGVTFAGRVDVVWLRGWSDVCWPCGWTVVSELFLEFYLGLCVWTGCVMTLWAQTPCFAFSSPPGNVKLNPSLSGNARRRISPAWGDTRPS